MGRILYRDGRIETVRFQDLTGFLTSNAAELTPNVVQLVEILYPIEELTKASILDVPETALERRDDPLLADADAVIWLVGVDQPAHHWKEAARWLAERPMDAIAIVSRVEGHDSTQIEAAVSRARMALGDLVEDVVPVSAKVALTALRSGIGQRQQRTSERGCRERRNRSQVGVQGLRCRLSRRSSPQRIECSGALGRG